MGDVIECDEEPQNRSFFKSVRNYFREYCNCTTIHGFRYFGENRTIFERVWWLLIFSLTLISCMFCIKEVYQKWLRSPVIVSFATKTAPSYSIPFPAVTICPETKSDQTLYSHKRMKQKLKNEENFTDYERNSFGYMRLICDQKHQSVSSETTVTEEMYEFLEKVNIGIDSFLSDCEFLGGSFPCSELFSPILTDEGICYTYNMLDRSEIFKNNVKHYSNNMKAAELTYNNWTIDDGYIGSNNLTIYPFRALLAGATNSLTVILKTSKSNIDHTCKSDFDGFRVSLHLPSRIPRPSQEYFRVPGNEVVLAAIHPDVITTSDKVKMYEPEGRECYFSYERPLKFFKKYSSKNCMLECFTNFTLQLCNCYHFYMPRTDEIEICGYDNICRDVSELLFEFGDLNNKMKSNWPFANRFVPSNCNCLPLCSDVTYNVETSQSKWDWSHVIETETGNDSVPYEEEEVYRSKLVIYFKSSHFIGSQRHELYGPTDFLANFGGLLGLFSGFSILSIMEAIYFLTIRICCNFRLYGYWAGPKN